MKTKVQRLNTCKYQFQQAWFIEAVCTCFVIVVKNIYVKFEKKRQK